MCAPLAGTDVRQVLFTICSELDAVYVYTAWHGGGRDLAHIHVQECIVQSHTRFVKDPIGFTIFALLWNYVS